VKTYHTQLSDGCRRSFCTNKAACRTAAVASNSGGELPSLTQEQRTAVGAQAMSLARADFASRVFHVCHPEALALKTLADLGMPPEDAPAALRMSHGDVNAAAAHFLHV
jgi:hypothetical protein